MNYIRFTAFLCYFRKKTIFKNIHANLPKPDGSQS
jgi:hypothetical protein